MIKIQTARFGEIEVEKNKVITMFGGILGFPKSEHYIMFDHEPGSPFKWIQSVEEPDVAFVVTDPLCFFPEYLIQVKKEELANMDVEDANDVTILTILSLRGEARDMTANLQGPLVINSASLKGRQLVMKEGAYTTKHHLFPELRAAG